MQRIALMILVMLGLGCTDETQATAPRSPAPAPQDVRAPEPAPTKPAVSEAPQPPREAFDPEAALEQMRQTLLAAARLEPGMTVADIGASRGWFVDHAALALGPTGKVYATDIDPEAIAGLRELAAHQNPERAPIEVRECTTQRDTGLSDLPRDHVDVMLMIDSLCFDGHFGRAENIEYLREFFGVLRPGGRLLHHTDCECTPSTSEVIGLFEAAGFETHERHLELPLPPADDPSAPCSTPAQRRQHGLLLEFTKPR